MVDDWATEIPRKKLATPYGVVEKLVWVKNHIFGPSKKFKELTTFLPQKSTLNKISPKLKIGFLGDIMGMPKKELQIEPKIQDFFKECDFLIGNFEGTIVGKEYTGKRVFMAQEHNESILSTLEALFPPKKFILTNANNHSGDFGWEAFNRSYELLEKYGFQVIGRRDKPSIILNEAINVVSCTNWSNQPRTPYVIYLNEVDNWLDSDAKFNILSPHWGYEMQLYPNPTQIQTGQRLLQTWDFIVGHHSHCPQPIANYEMTNRQKVLAYSLGDFCTKVKLKMYHFGIVVKAEFGPTGQGDWQVGNLTWKFTEVHVKDKRMVEVQLKDSCKYFQINSQ